MSIKMILDGADAENVMQITREYGQLKERIERLTDDLCDAKAEVNKVLVSQTKGDLIRPVLDDFMRGFSGCTPTNKILLIKSVRSFTGWGLKESKDYVENFFPVRAY